VEFHIALVDNHMDDKDAHIALVDKEAGEWEDKDGN
jgi:hypothetical protein